MKSEKELVVLRLSSLGDVAMLVPVLISFHHQFPSISLKLISREKFRPIFENYAFIEFVGIDKDSEKLNLFQLIRFYFNFENKKNLVLIDCHDVLRTKILGFLFKWNHTRKFTIDKGRKEKNDLIQLKVKNLTNLKSSPERYRDVFSKAGYPFELQPIQRIHNNSNQSIKIGIAPFAKHSSKQYSIENWREIVHFFSQNNNIKFYIFGSGQSELNQISSLIGDVENVEILIDTMNFSKELEFISSLDLMLSMDSGNGHLAAMFGIPVITIWGSTHPFLGYAPYGQSIDNSLFPDNRLFPYLPVSIFGKNVSKEYERAIDSILTEKIIAKINEFITDI